MSAQPPVLPPNPPAQHDCNISMGGPFPFSVDCSCGYHQDCYMIESAAQYISVHLANVKGAS